MMPAVAKRGTKWFIAISIIVVVLGALWGAAFFIGRSTSKSQSAGSDFDETVVRDSSSNNKIAMINVVGEIFSDPDGASRGASDSNLIAQLDRAKEDEDVRAVILNLETPGGGVVASDSIYKRVLKLRRQGKPVVALMGDVAASGGYYIAAGADQIVARPSTWTGSIGVIAMLPNFEKAAEKVGVGVSVFKSGAFKDAGSPFRAMTPEEQTLFQNLINEAYDGFVKVVSDGRHMPEEKVRQLADGRVYSGKQAKEVGLIDELGDQDSAFATAKKLAHIGQATLVRYSATPAGLGDLLGATSQKLNTSFIRQQLGLPRKAGPSYLWLP